MDKEKAKKIVMKLSGLKSYEYLEKAITAILKGERIIHATDHKPLLIHRKKLQRYFPKLKIISVTEEKTYLILNKKAKKQFLKKIE